MQEGNMSMTPALRPEVLIVTPARTIWAPLARALDAEGYEVIVCPGPQPPSFTCIGAKRDRCSLSRGVAGVVIDGWLASDEGRKGVPSWHLVLHYRQLGLPVVVLLGPDGLPGPVRDEGIRTLSRDAEPDEVCEALRSAIGSDVRARADWVIDLNA
jgi:hypothetical protein